MDFLPDPDQAQIVDSFRRFLAAELPLSRFQRREGRTASDIEHWPAIAGLGWFGIGIDESHGGAGLSLAEEMLVCIEAGRHLLSPSLVATMLAAHVAAATGDTALAVRLVTGEAVAAFAVATSPVSIAADAVSATGYLLDGGRADFALVATPGAVALVAAEDLGGLVPKRGVDESVGLAAFELLVPGIRPVCFVERAQADIYRRGALLSAAMSVGIAAQVRDLSVAYASEREQFGRPVGSFQAVKHSCADMAVRCEAALSLLVQASLETAAGQPGAEFDAPAAKLLADAAAVPNAEAAIQLHGAMGFTAEMPVHLFAKRAHLLAALLGTRRENLAELAEQPTPGYG